MTSQSGFLIAPKFSNGYTTGKLIVDIATCDEENDSPPCDLADDIESADHKSGAEVISKGGNLK